MIYNKYQDRDLSALAFGAMRLPTIDGKDAEIDEKKAEELVDAAYKAGINYFDTAWGYHAGNSETFMGKALSKYPRESYFLSTKFPGYDVSNFGKAEEIFEKQLEKCQTDYFDFYFCHNVCELNIDKYLDDCQYITVSYLLEQKKKGRIKHLGFSAHGSRETMEKFLEKYGKFMEFGMIQLNYLDYEFQGARAKADLLRKYGIPIWVMEPLRGGMLAKMDESDLKTMQETRPGVTPVELAFRFIQSVPGVATVLTGMSDMEQMNEKLRIFDNSAPLSGSEIEKLLAIADRLVSSKIVPCTSCRYCLTHCPKGLDIPRLLGLLNEGNVTGGGFIGAMAILALDKEKRPSSCIGCRACEKVCPQQIEISKGLADLVKQADPVVKAFSGGTQSA